MTLALSAERKAIEKVVRLARNIAANRDHLQMPNLGGMTQTINALADAVAELDEIERRKQHDTDTNAINGNAKTVIPVVEQGDDHLAEHQQGKKPRAAKRQAE